MKKVLLFTLLLFSITFANTLIGDTVQQSTASYIVIGLVFLLAALTYMAGSIFSMNNLTARAKDMLYQGIFSLVIMASFSAIYVIFSSLFQALFLSNFQIPAGMDMFDLSENLLLWNYFYYFIHMIMFTVINMFVLTYFGRSYSVSFAERFVSFDVSILQSPLLFIINAGISLISFSIMVNGFQLLLLKFVKFVLIPFILPIGLILRAFPSSMHAGNVLVGIAIASYIIVPVVYAIDFQILPSILTENPQITKNRVYDSFALMRPFYNKDTLQHIVVDDSTCSLINVAKKYMDGGMIDSTAYKELQESSDNCNFDWTKGLVSIGERIPTWVVSIGAVSIGSSVAMKSLSVVDSAIRGWNTSIWKKFFSKDSTTGTTATTVDPGAATSPGTTTTGSGATTSPGGRPSETGTPSSSSWLSKLVGSSKLFKAAKFASEGVALIVIAYMFFEILLGMVTSFIILSAILPFIKFTIIVIFIREFTLNLLGTQVSLGHITRLI